LAVSCASAPIDLHQRVVFLGDSITARWHLQSFFTDQAINKGVEGQTAEQIASRFQSDVVALQPATVVILAGSNDVRSGATDFSSAMDSLAAMAAQAQANGIRAIVCTLPPIDGHMDAVRSYNQLLTSDPRFSVSCNYYRALTDLNGNPLPGILHDEIHPSAVGYLRMAVVIDQVLVNQP
jgi:lysophospholipase L1-like esterase